MLTVGTVTFRAVYLNDDGEPVNPEEASETVPQGSSTSDPAVSPSVHTEKTVPAPEPEEQPPPMAQPIVDQDQQSDGEAADDDDLSAFFDSLK